MERFGSRGNFPLKVVHLTTSRGGPPSVRSSDRNLPFHFKKFSFSAERLSKFGSKQNKNKKTKSKNVVPFSLGF